MITIIPPLIFIIVLPLILISLTSIFSLNASNDRENHSAFECGFDPVSNARIPFSIRFFLLAILFLIFDIEIIFLLPLPVLISNTLFSSFFSSSSLFIIIITLGLFHEWNEGSLHWTN